MQAIKSLPPLGIASREQILDGLQLTVDLGRRARRRSLGRDDVDSPSTRYRGSRQRSSSGELLGDPGDSAPLLTAAAHAYLAGQGLFSDPQAAIDATALARTYLDRLLVALRARGCTIVGTFEQR